MAAITTDLVHTEGVNSIKTMLKPINPSMLGTRKNKNYGNGVPKIIVNCQSFGLVNSTFETANS